MKDSIRVVGAKALLRTAVVVAMLVLLLVPHGAAEAAENATCFNPTIKVSWAGTWGTEKSTALAGFEVWEWDVDTYSGGVPVAVSETSGSAVNVTWIWMPSGYGYGICDTRTLGFNTAHQAEIVGNLDAFKTLAAHEMGHVIGLNHVGKLDSYGGDNPPVMWPCIWPDTDYRPDQDDHASLQLQTDKDSTYKSATANSSFEEDTSYREFWGVSSGATTYLYSGGVDGTPYYMSFGAPTAQSYIFSTTALIDSPSIDWVKARANYKKSASTNYGTVTLQLRVRAYDSGGSGCGLPSRRDGSHTYGTAYYYSKVCTPTSSWGYCTTSGQNPPSKSADAGGIEARVYLYNNMFTASGSRVHVGVDRTRVMVDY